ncbi:elongation factor P maturation arginine rhamnosyltransferase EarP [Candidatus Pseudomonas adelgestsugas]|uniref:Protein-arginine rhamnosyltransferase n=1 Tax=Candidatus Pseudomonas adelgestsugas TaxID=1302376 RepID=A0ABX5RA20_9PSED|nr:elongation factor P maturation arginine rhamnosyltransferase EarP [Candidatus Pseudomonas adelgestsugas]QAX82005.1 hypothetical protein C3B55_00681 [Candidatus Pseudomonas adelgestsugas]
MKACCDIFCRVIDNYGDIGIAWRLAKQLAVEHSYEVRLWVDNAHAFKRMRQEINVQLDQQWQEGVQVCHWRTDWPQTESADVVIAAFSCQLPLNYMEAMAARERTPLWINLDYLSAEDWVTGCNRLPSVKFKSVQKYFFFPGFRLGTGGLLREVGLLAQRQAFQQEVAVQRQFLQSVGVIPIADARLISLFAYENANLASWLDILAMDRHVTHLLVPYDCIISDVQHWLEVTSLAVGDMHQRNALTVQVLPFMRQEQYDHLLWCCDFNVVRGEDSFVRAQWAGRPLLWHIYHQDKNIHLDKLNAFLELYTTTLSQAAKTAVVALWQAWNTDGDMMQTWKMLLEHWQEVSLHSQKWCLEQSLQADLATSLVKFYESWI